MSTHNMFFYGELTKIILELSPNTLLISSTSGGGENISFNMDSIGSSIGICYCFIPPAFMPRGI